MQSQNSRRSFFATLALGVSATAYPALLKEIDQLDNFEEMNFIDPSSKKMVRRNKGKHKIMYDEVNT